MSGERLQSWREGDPTWDPALSKATWSILGSSIDAGETPVWQPLASSAEQANLPSTLSRGNAWELDEWAYRSRGVVAEDRC
ncbi:MAG TPA: hypothetical protein PKD55_11695 [Bellilinea sp.]|nr:hypothetical protein [Bellilinea sp.]